MRAACDVENFCAIEPSAGIFKIRRSSRRRWPGCLTHHHDPRRNRRDGAHDDLEVTRHELRDADDEARRPRQFVTELVVERPELRNDAHHDDGDHDDREQQEDRRVDERGNGLAPDPGDDLHIGDIPPQHRLEVAGLLSREQRRGVNARKDLPMSFKGFRQRAPRPHPLMHIVENSLEHRDSRRDAGECRATARAASPP